MQSKFAAHFVLAAHIGARSRIIADENDRQAGRDTALLQFRDFAPQFRVNFFRNRAAVDQIRSFSFH